MVDRWSVRCNPTETGTCTHRSNAGRQSTAVKGLSTPAGRALRVQCGYCCCLCCFAVQETDGNQSILNLVGRSADLNCYLGYIILSDHEASTVIFFQWHDLHTFSHSNDTLEVDEHSPAAWRNSSSVSRISWVACFGRVFSLLLPLLMMCCCCCFAVCQIVLKLIFMNFSEIVIPGTPVEIFISADAGR